MPFSTQPVPPNPQDTPFNRFWGFAPSPKARIGGGPNKYELQLFNSLMGALQPFGGVQAERTDFAPGVPLNIGQPSAPTGGVGQPGMGQPASAAPMGQPTGQPSAAPQPFTLIPGVPFTPQQNREEIQRLQGLNFAQGTYDAWKARQNLAPGTSALGPSGLSQEIQAMLGAETKAREQIAAENTRRGLGAQDALLQALDLQVRERLGRGQLALQQLAHIPGLANALVGLMG